MRFFFMIIYLGLIQSNLLLSAQSDSIRFEHITIQDGLPHNRIHCIMQDKSGFIWLGSQDGLVRYDGYVCRIFRQSPHSAQGFRGKNVECLLEDKSGNLWVGMQSGGINIKNEQTGLFYNLEDHPAFQPISGAWIKCLMEDKNGRIWIGTVGSGLLIYDPKNQTAQHLNTHNSPLKDNTLSAIVEDSNGTIWLSSAGTYIYQFNAKKNEFSPIMFASPSEYIDFRKTLHLDGKGHLWIGTQNLGLFRYDISTQKFKQYTRQSGKSGLNSINVLDIAQTKNGQMLLATDGGGLNIFDPVSETFKVYTYAYQPQGGLNANAHYCLFIDKDDNIWIGTINGGVNVFKAHKTRFDNYTHTGSRQNELSHRSVIAIAQSDNGKIWIGTDGGGLNKYNRNTHSFDKIVHKISNSDAFNNGKVVKAIFQDSKKRLWLGYFNDGLDWFDPQTERTIKQFRFNPSDPLSISSNNIWSFAEDKDGRLWVATERNGLNVFRPENGRFMRYFHNPSDPTSLSGNDIVVVFIDSKNNLWVGTESSGLNLYNRPNSTFIRYKKDDKAFSNHSTTISANDIRSIFEDSKGRLWIGTESGGLNRYDDNGNFHHFTTRDGLISDAVMGIAEDNKGLLWLSTFKGLASFDPETRQFVNYDFHQKDNNNQFNSMAAIKSQQGELYFGGINGMTIINPDWIKPYTIKPKVIFTDFKVLNSSVEAGKSDKGHTYIEKAIELATEVRMPYQDNVFSFEFASLDFTEPVKNQYIYRMDGFDADWQTSTSEQRLVTYTNLNPGSYIFRVKGSNSNGVWSDETSIKVKILPPFWMTWWFRILLSLTLLGLVWFGFSIYLLRREMSLRQKVLESEREILSLKNEKLENEVTLKNTELMSKAIQMAHKNEVLIDFKEKLEELRKASDSDKAKVLRGLKNQLDFEIHDEESWEQFNLYFDQVNQNFTTELLKKHPNLTQNDLRICALTRLNLSTKEIAALLNISAKGVQQSRYRVKKRMELTEDDDLYDYLRSI